MPTRAVLRHPAAALLEGGGLLPVAPLAVWWAFAEGGYPPALWLLGLLVLLAGAGVLLLAVPLAPVRGARAAALAALAALVAWTALSVLWAQDRGGAWLAAERHLLFALAFALPVLWPPRRRALLAAVAGWPVLALAGVVAGLVATAGAPADFLENGRLVEPTGYVNATAALSATGLLAALVLAADPVRPARLRAAALGLALALAGGLVLSQSRGALGAALVALAAAALLTPRRLRLAVALAVLAAGLGLALEALLEVRRTALGGDAQGALRAALALLAALGAGGTLAGLAVARADARLRPSAALERRVRLGARALGGVAAALAALAVAQAVGGDPAAWARDRYADFRVADYTRLESAGDRFTGDLGSNRHDYWRASVDVFREHPVAGAGAGAFTAEYLRRRRVDKAPLYAHSHVFQLLGDLGAVGLGAFLAFVLAAAAALLAALRRARPAARPLLAAAAVPAVLLLVHGAGDWVALFPGLAVPALALLGAALAPPGAPAARPAVSGRVAAAGLAGLLALALLALPPLLSARFTERAAQTWRSAPEAAFADLRAAAAVHPLAASPALTEGMLALELRRPGRARSAFARAAQRDPSAWYPHLALALLAEDRGDDAQARARMAAAAARNPRQPELVRARARLLAGRGAPDPLTAQRTVLRREG